jgi:hypothetical protein
MSELGSQTPDSPENVELRQQLQDLRRQTTVLHVAMVVASLILTAYLYVQSRRSSKDLEVIRPKAMEALQAYKNEDNNIKVFLGKLSDFGQTHPDYVPILKKYVPTAPPKSSASPFSPPPTNAK